MRIRVDQMFQARLLLAGAFVVPMGIYFLYGAFAPYGAMHNFRATNGAYMYWMQNFLGANKSQMEIYRPQFAHKADSIPLHQYSKKIEQLRKEGSEELVEEVHHPKAWH